MSETAAPMPEPAVTGQAEAPRTEIVPCPNCASKNKLIISAVIVLALVVGIFALQVMWERRKNTGHDHGENAPEK
jgi:hypothetical protein